MADEGEDGGTARGQFPEVTESPSPPGSPGAPEGSPPPSPGHLDLFSSSSPLLCDPESSYLTSQEAVHRSPSLGELAPTTTTSPKFHRRSRDPESFSRARQDARLAMVEGARDVDPFPGWRRGDPDASAGRFQQRGQRFTRTQDPTDYGNHYSIQPADADLNPDTRQRQQT